MDSVASTLAVYATFAVGFVARPLGGIVFGHYGDRLGRKSTLIATFLLMGIASFFIGCLPSYDSIGLWAPVGLVVLRFIQGFAFGGEYMNAVSLTLENAPSMRRGFFASWINAAGPVGVIAASGLIALLGATSSREAFANWVWRVPFLLSLLLVVIGTYMRAQVDESALFLSARAKAEDERAPLIAIMRSWKKPVLQGCLVNMVHSSFFYMSTIFVLGYAIKALRMAPSSITSGTTVANIIEMCAVPLIAGFSDKLGRRPFIILGIVLAAIWYPIFFQIVLTRNAMAIMGGFVVSLGLIHALMFAPEAAFTAELFPTRVRASGSSLGKQLGIVLGGGLAPLIGTALMGSGASFTPVILYFEVIAALALIGVLLAPENARKALE
ncbi:MAG TPA: MFS transporter [Bradyrhizobium sp.]|uniref:MFS transporter n=1 Tax=Bradyrhizobium sp. TaxID=376 RepID=UPI002C185B55|nr:MFS transporter [Bradyrhizobium sp.]HLZ02923.1 MFS transporter [Bradyrhizobium sp.]